MTHLDSNITSYETALASLNATDTTDFTPEQKAELESRKTALNEALNKAKQEKTTLQGEIDTGSAQLETFKNNVEPLTTALTTAQTNYDTTQGEIDKLENETLTQAKSAYTEQEKAYNDKKLALVTQYNQGVVNATTKIQEIEAQISVLDKQEIEAQGKMGANGNAVNLNGQNYDSVVPQEKIDELIKLIDDTRANNKGEHPDMCLAFAIWYGQYLEGKASASEFKQFLKPGNIPYGNGSIDTDDYDSDNKNDILAKIAEDINSGHPAIVQVGASNNTSRHYVLVVGLKEGAKNPPTEDDLLIIDTYDGKLEGMGQYGSRDMITGAQCRKKYSGYQMYHFNV
jgi:predicted  nucleic acid-binding Zn-ribbon protein